MKNSYLDLLVLMQDEKPKQTVRLQKHILEIAYGLLIRSFNFCTGTLFSFSVT